MGGAFRRFAPEHGNPCGGAPTAVGYRISLRDMLEERWKIWSSEKGFMVDALELLYDEGRGKLREAGGRSTHPEIPG